MLEMEIDEIISLLYSYSNAYSFELDVIVPDAER